MKILHFCWEYPPRGSGVGKYIGEISAGLRKLGHQTIIATSRGDGLPEEEALAGGRIYRMYDYGDIGKASVTDRVLAMAREHAVDLIEAVDHLGEAADLLRRPARPPVLINCRYNDVVLRARYAQAWYGWQRRAIDLACWRDFRRLGRERYSIEHADLLAAPSGWMLEALRAQGVRLPARTAVLPKPLDSIPGWTNAEAAAPTLLLVGRIDVGKGVPYLRDLLERVSRRHPGVVLEFAGEDGYARFLGSMRAWTERQLGEQRGRVRFLGRLGPQELDQAYRRAWVVLVPSRWDTSPTALLEAMVRAKPVVASPFGGMAEYMGGGGEWIADPGRPAFADAVARLLGDAELRQAVGRQLQNRAAQEYDPAGAAQKYVDFVRGNPAMSNEMSPA